MSSSITVTVESEAPWYMEPTVNWIQASTSSNTISGNAGTTTVTIDVAENTSLNSRSGRLYFVISDYNYTWITISQDGKYVDLGLPSGLLWATCNVGADRPWDYGDFFAWGETSPKSEYSWATYKHARGESKSLTKYCYSSSYGYNGFTDYRYTLELSDDAAYINMGSGWRMPTADEFYELATNCDLEYTENYNGTGVICHLSSPRPRAIWRICRTRCRFCSCSIM